MTVASSDEIITTHRLIRGDARQMSYIEDGSVHLVVISPPTGRSNGTMRMRPNLDMYLNTNPF